MIDEKKLIEFIKSNDFKRRIIQSKDSLQDTLIQFIAEYPTVGEWIPCSVRMPEKPKENPIFDNKPLELYLVSVNKAEYPIRAFWNGKHFTDGWGIVDANAWMPLPEPYKEE